MTQSLPQEHGDLRTPHAISWTFRMEAPVHCTPPPNPAPASTQPQDTTSKRSPSWCQPFLGQLEVHSQQGTPTCWTKRSFQQTLGVWFVNTYKEK